MCWQCSLRPARRWKWAPGANTRRPRSTKASRRCVTSPPSGPRNSSTGWACLARRAREDLRSRLGCNLAPSPSPSPLWLSSSIPLHQRRSQPLRRLPRGWGTGCGSARPCPWDSGHDAGVATSGWPRCAAGRHLRWARLASDMRESRSSRSSWCADDALRAAEGDLARLVQRPPCPARTDRRHALRWHADAGIAAPYRAGPLTSGMEGLPRP